MYSFHKRETAGPVTGRSVKGPKFERRFAYIEQRLAADGRKPAESTLLEMDRLWDEAKVLGK